MCDMCNVTAMQPQNDNKPTAKQKRSSERSTRLVRIVMIHPVHGDVEATVRNISQRGLGGKIQTPVHAGEKILIRTKSGATISAEIRWVKGQHFGLLAEQDLKPSDFAAPAELGLWTERLSKPFDSAHVYNRFRPVTNVAKRPGLVMRRC